MRCPSVFGLITACGLFVSPTLATAASLRDCQELLNKPVMVTLTDGRTPRGLLSAKSNDKSMVLTTEIPGVAIESRFAWTLVESVASLPFTDPKPLPRPADPVPDEEPSETVPLQPEYAPPAPVPNNANPPAPFLPEAALLTPFAPFSPLEVPPLEATAPAPIEVVTELLPADHRRAVRSLNVRATVANWDRDAEVDGLLLHVQPLDGFGTVVPVDGVVDVQLATETKLAKGGRSNVRDDNTFSIPERWSVPIRAIDFDAAGTTVKLPFRRFHPERDFDISSSALTMAKLKLPTAGVFEASDPFVQLRPYSHFRDELQELRGQRLFPGEATPKW